MACLIAAISAGVAWIPATMRAGSPGMTLKMKNVKVTVPHITRYQSEGDGIRGIWLGAYGPGYPSIPLDGLMLPIR